MSGPILLYDGVCGLCNRMVQFILRHDAQGTFRFASLQSGLAARILARHGYSQPSKAAHGEVPNNSAGLDTIYVVLQPDSRDGNKETLFSRSDALAFVLKELGGVWRMLGAGIQVVPRPVRNWGYGVVARNRYRVFGQYETCPLPSEATRALFLDS